MPTKFKEVQYFNQWWLWIILIGCLIIPFVGIISNLSGNEIAGRVWTLDAGLWVYLILSLLIFLLFKIMHLRTEITRDEIRMKLVPFKSKRTKWKDVASAQVIDYGFVGGWGIRLFTKYGTVYNIRGSKGLAIELKDGKKYLIGTQDPESLKKYLADHGH